MSNPRDSEAVVAIDRVRVTRTLVFLIALLTVAAIVMTVFDRTAASGLLGDVVSSIHRLVNPDLEANFSTWFSTALLLGAATLIGLVAIAKSDAGDPLRRHWVAFSALMLLMSIDEAAQVHEMIIKPTQQLLGVTGGEAWVWTIPAVFVVSLFAVASLRFLAAQPGPLRRLLILAFGLFVLGAIGIEAFGGVVVGRDRPVAFEIAAAIEEFFEMVGVVVLIYAIMGVLESLEVKVGFHSRRIAPTPDASVDSADDRSDRVT